MPLPRVVTVAAAAVFASATSLAVAAEHEAASGTILEGSASQTCESDSHDQVYLFEQGSALVWPYLFLSDRPKLSGRVKANELRKGIACLDRAIQLSPGYWQAFWIRGKAYQALGEKRAACGSFESAFALQPDNTDVARELVIAYLEESNVRESLPIAKRLAETHADDPGLKANYAIALVLDGQTAAAQAVITEALRLDPSDRITRVLKDRIDEVASGVRRKPQAIEDLQK